MKVNWFYLCEQLIWSWKLRFRPINFCKNVSISPLLRLIFQHILYVLLEYYLYVICVLDAMHWYVLPFICALLSVTVFIEPYMSYSLWLLFVFRHVLFSLTSDCFFLFYGRMFHTKQSPLHFSPVSPFFFRERRRTNERIASKFATDTNIVSKKNWYGPL